MSDETTAQESAPAPIDEWYLLRRGTENSGFTLNCRPDARWPRPERHEDCHGWVNPLSAVGRACNCDCHLNGNDPWSYNRDAARVKASITGPRYSVNHHNSPANAENYL